MTSVPIIALSSETSDEGGGETPPASSSDTFEEEEEEEEEDDDNNIPAIGTVAAAIRAMHLREEEEARETRLRPVMVKLVVKFK